MGVLARISRGITLLMTWAVKLLGILGAADQLLLHADHPNSLALGICGCMLAGGQATEEIALAMIDRVTRAWAGEAEPAEEKPSEPQSAGLDGHGPHG